LDVNEVVGGTTVSFAVPKSFNTTTNNIFNTFYTDNLATLDTNGVITAVDTTNAFAGINTFAYIENTDTNISRANSNCNK
jgi:hypothetical protein